MSRWLACVVVLAACSGKDDPLVIKPLYNHANGRVVVSVSEELDSGFTVFADARRGHFGTLDCAELAARVPALEDTTGLLIDGPLVDVKLKEPFYGPEWAGTPTPEHISSS